jgi:hypothetical protein
MEKHTKKELKEQYKNRSVIGGVYCIRCNGNGRMWIKSAKNLYGQKNRFEFSVMINSCPEADMYSEWSQYGAKTFSFDVLEEIEKQETQTDREFIEDIGILLEMWIEKQQQEELK